MKAKYIEVTCACGSNFCYLYDSGYVPMFCNYCRKFRSMTFKYKETYKK